MFLIFRYSAMLLSSLKLPVREEFIQTFDELGDNFCCKKRLRWYTNRVLETCLYEGYVRQTLLLSSSDKQLDLEASSVTPLSLGNLSGILFLILFGLLLALIVFLIELFYASFVKMCPRTATFFLT